MPTITDSDGTPVFKTTTYDMEATHEIVWLCPFKCKLNDSGECIHTQNFNSGEFKPNIAHLPQSADDRLVVAIRCLSRVKLK